MTRGLCIIEGILLAIVGVICFIYPLQSLLNLTVIAGIFIFVAGILQCIRAFKTDRKGLYIFRGIVNILFGLVLWFSPLSSAEVLTIFFGAWGLVQGITLLIAEFKFERAGFNLTTIWVILLIILSILVLLYPLTALSVTPYILGSYFILGALFEIYIGFLI